MRLAGSDVSLGGAERTAGGGVVSVGAHRKALLQSMPYLTILLVPLVRIVLAGKDFAKLCILFVVPFTVIGYYSFAGSLAVLSQQGLNRACF
jgi:hypothetical protein